MYWRKTDSIHNFPLAEAEKSPILSPYRKNIIASCWIADFLIKCFKLCCIHYSFQRGLIWIWIYSTEHINVIYYFFPIIILQSALTSIFFQAAVAIIICLIIFSQSIQSYWQIETQFFSLFSFEEFIFTQPLCIKLLLQSQGKEII